MLSPCDGCADGNKFGVCTGCGCGATSVCSVVYACLFDGALEVCMVGLPVVVVILGMATA